MNSIVFSFIPEIRVINFLKLVLRFVFYFRSPADVRTEMDEDEDNVQDDSRTRDRRTAAHAQYVSVNCVVFTHYTGDVATVVDEHFSRALNNDQKLNNGGHQGSSTKGKTPFPLDIRHYY